MNIYFLTLKVASLSGTITVYKGNSSIPLFEIHQSIDKKTNPGYKLNLQGTHENFTFTLERIVC